MVQYVTARSSCNFWVTVKKMMSSLAKARPPGGGSSLTTPGRLSRPAGRWPQPSHIRRGRRTLCLTSPSTRFGSYFSNFRQVLF